MERTNRRFETGDRVKLRADWRDAIDQHYHVKEVTFESMYAGMLKTMVKDAIDPNKTYKVINIDDNVLKLLVNKKEEEFYIGCFEKAE